MACESCRFFLESFSTFDLKKMLFSSILCSILTKKSSVFGKLLMLRHKTNLAFGSTSLITLVTQFTITDRGYSSISRLWIQGPSLSHGQIPIPRNRAREAEGEDWGRKWGQSWNPKGHVSRPGRGPNLEVQIHDWGLCSYRRLGERQGQTFGKKKEICIHFELSCISTFFQARIGEAEECIDGLNSRTATTEKLRNRYHIDLEELQNESERINTQVQVAEKKLQTFDKVNSFIVLSCFFLLKDAYLIESGSIPILLLSDSINQCCGRKWIIVFKAHLYF